ncbi:hypothetical protein ABT025_29580 [Streptomyces sp. NPDC002809]|uniref:hypothetical protein n=1 Tax=Streptomyces sp. NPDC002809 TaxID=3154433 RepID=UPI0033321AD0
MGEEASGELQIYSVEGSGGAVATCIVRCVGGVVRVGQQFRTRPTGDVTGDPVLLNLDWINCYETMMDFLHPPYGAVVQLSGSGVESLKRGVILASIANGE